MCLAIFKPRGIRIKKKYLKNGFDHNEDGAGFAVCQDGKVVVRKGYFTFDDFWKDYEQFGNQTALIHFRWSTHGTIGKDNSHPFEMCGGEYALIHNGILNISTESDKTKSDTRHYVELILNPLFERVAFDHPSLKFLIEGAIGDNNKLVVLKGDGSHCIYNEKAGSWYKGAWFSNTAFKYAPMVPRWYAGTSGFGGSYRSGAYGSSGFKSSRDWEAELEAEFTEAELAEADDKYLTHSGLSKEEIDEARAELACYRGSGIDDYEGSRYDRMVDLNNTAITEA